TTTTTAPATSPVANAYGRKPSSHASTSSRVNGLASDVCASGIDPAADAMLGSGGADGRSATSAAKAARESNSIVINIAAHARMPEILMLLIEQNPAQAILVRDPPAGKSTTLPARSSGF